MLSCVSSKSVAVTNYEYMEIKSNNTESEELSVPSSYSSTCNSTRVAPFEILQFSIHGNSLRVVPLKEELENQYPVNPNVVDPFITVARPNSATVRR